MRSQRTEDCTETRIIEAKESIFCSIVLTKAALSSAVVRHQANAGAGLNNIWR